MRTISKKKKFVVKKNPTMELSLPENMTDPCLNFYDYVSLFYGRPGIGKTTLLTSAPDCLLLATERISKGIQAFVFNADAGGVKDWETFKRAVKLLESDDRFRTVAIDTIGALFQQCLTYIIKILGRHPSEEPYGKGWNALATEWETIMRRLLSLPKGIIMTAHMKEREITSYSGETFWRIGPDVSGQCLNWLNQKTDFVLFCEYVRIPTQRAPLRVMFTNGDEVVDAKHADVYGDFPPFIPMDKKRGINLINDIFSGEARGLTYEDVRAAKETGAAASEHIKAHRNTSIGTGKIEKKSVIKKLNS